MSDLTVTLENLLTTVAEQERHIRDLQGRVCVLEAAVDRVNKTINERVEQKFERVWKAIAEGQERKLER